MPAPPIQPVDREELIYTIVEQLESEDSAACVLWQLGRDDDPKWLEDMADAWQNMADTLWEIAKSIDPMELSCVKKAMASLSKLNGLELWYAIAIREVESSNDSLDQKKGKKTKKAFPWAIAGEYEKMKKDNDKLKKPFQNGKQVEDPFGIISRKALARAVREQGNESYKKGAYTEAFDHYTRAMGYDDEEVIYPSNRAACLIKLSRFSEAEADCSTAISLDSINYKAYFRRGVSRSGLGNLQGAVQDFRKVLYLQKNDEKSFLDFRKLSVQFLSQASKIKGKVELTLLQLERLLPKLQQQSQVDETEGSASEEESSDNTEVNENGIDSSKDEQPPSISEVYSQVSFAIAFSQIVRQRTGIVIKVPLTCSSTSTKV